MRLKELKELMPNIEYKQMEYSNERKVEILCEGKYKDYQFYILNLGTHPTAYVEIPRESKLFGKSYDDIDIYVHGGLTFSSSSLQSIKENSWFIGWDYAHYFDYMPYFEELNKVYATEKLKKWTTEEIFEDVVKVIEQVIKEEK